MRVFITGGTGLIGSAVVSELVAHGHAVVALTRSDGSAAAAQSNGATPLRGSLTDIATLQAGAAQADGVIHLAFANDFSSPEAVQRSIAEEGAALAALGETLIGTTKPFVVCSGTPFVPGRTACEDDPISTEGGLGGRGRGVMGVLALAAHGVRSSAVRLPRTVHRDGNGGFAGILTNIARQSGVSGYVGDGEQRWPAVHAQDAASLFRLALEKAEAGTSWHAVGDEGDKMRDIAEVIGRRLGLPVRSLPAETYGPLGMIFSADQPASSTHTQQALNWRPTHISLLEDLERIQP